MDHIAYVTGRDPLDVRKANFYGGVGRDRTPYGMRVEDNILHELVADLEMTSELPRAPPGDHRLQCERIALTPLKFGISFTLIQLNQAGALVHLYRDGSISLNHGGTEMGQGAVRQGRPGRRRGIRHATRRSQDHGDQYSQGAQHLADRGLCRHRPQCASRAQRLQADQGPPLRLHRGEVERHARARRILQRQRADRQSDDEPRRTRHRRVRQPHPVVRLRLLQDAEDHLGPRKSERTSVLLLRLRRLVFRGHRRHDDRRDARQPRRHPS